MYVSCTQTAVSAAAKGSCSFSVPSTVAPGTYELRLLANDVYTRLAVSAPLSIVATSSFVTSLIPSSLTVSPGSQISVAVANAPGGVKDWVAIFPLNATGAQYPPDWQYLNGLKSAPSTPIINTTLSFTATTTPGTYQFRLYRNDSTSESDRVASVNFSVSSPSLGVRMAPSNENLASVLSSVSILFERIGRLLTISWL
jgi:hypothetical protein